MATMYYGDSADLTLIQGKKVGVIGYGSQGHAHALNLRDSGVSVRVGLPPTSRSRAKAEAAGLTVGEVSDVAKWADVLMILIPDTSQGQVYKNDIEPNLAPGKTVMFAHGFNIRFGTIQVRDDVDVSMVAPKSPGHRVRELFVEGAGTPALFAIHQDATSSAGVPAPSSYNSRTRWPGDLGATMETSTPGGASMAPKRMLKPWANISVLPGRRCGRRSAW